MVQKIRNILVIRILQNMAIAITGQFTSVVVFNFGSEPVLLSSDNIQSMLHLLSREFPNRSIISRIKDLFDLIRVIRKYKPDIVHVNALQDLIFVYFAVKICALNIQKPAIVAMSHNPATWKNFAWLKVKYIKMFSDGFVALATTHKDLLIKHGLPSEKVTVIPNPYDPNQITLNNSSLPECHEKPIYQCKVIYIANICERKAQDILIKAAIDVLNKFPHVKFELIGKVIPGEEEYAEKLKLQIMKYGKEESIVLVGEIPYNEISKALLESNVFVFPTRAEMMPRAVIEAMVLGKPVIASGVDGILDLIQNKKTGLLVSPGSSSELFLAICELIENPEFANELGKEGQKYILDYCSPDKVGLQFENFYERINAGKK